MLKYLLFLIVYLFAFPLLAQLSLLEHNGKMQYGFSMRYTYLDNPPRKPEAVGRGYFAPEFDFMKSAYEKGAWNRSHRVKLIGDFLAIALNVANGGDAMLFQEDFTTELNTFLGWHNWAKSIKSDANANLAIGAHLGDYMYYYYGGGSKGAPDYLLDPAGYYIGVGPALIYDLQIGSSPFILHYEGAVAYGVRLSDIPDQANSSYASPLFINNILELRTSVQFWLGIEYVTIINTGAEINRGQRIEVKLGYRFIKG